jgi:Domain of unknown function (DUF6089)
MKKVLLFTLVLLNVFTCIAQRGLNGYEVKGEFGITGGIAHYFGDLNTRSALNRPKPAIGIFYRHQFNNYLSLRLSAHYAQLGYSDVYSKNVYQKQRNLSFNSEIWEMAAHADFNFFKFIPNDPDYQFTPFITLGLGVFSYNPYAMINNEKVYLRPLGTEGQNIGYIGADGKKRKPYGTVAVCVPIGIGFKYNINSTTNFSFLVSHRLTNTDYLDDVSTTYVGTTNFGSNLTALTLQDRSVEKGTAIGTEGRQRGWSKQKDQYVIAEIGISFNISTYNCPSN